MMGHVRKIEWTEDGWPVVLPERYAAVPQDAITESDLTGNWEVITLTYQRGVQQTSTAMTLSPEYNATGAITGTWSYDSTTGILTIGSLKLNVARELDWEESPRVSTIVFTGLDGSGQSVWGKKSQS
jgi:arabinan endo-1,5-alpha-L-arabinosidase